MPYILCVGFEGRANSQDGVVNKRSMNHQVNFEMIGGKEQLELFKVEVAEIRLGSSSISWKRRSTFGAQ